MLRTFCLALLLSLAARGADAQAIITGSSNSSGFPLGYANVKAFGASGSGQATTGSISIGSYSLTVANAKDFAVGQGIAVATAAGSSVALVAKITQINGTTFTLDTAAGATANGQAVEHDDLAAFQAARDSVLPGGTILAPRGWYKLHSTFALTSAAGLTAGVSLIGVGGYYTGAYAAGTFGTVIDGSTNFYPYGYQGIVDLGANAWGSILQGFAVIGSSNTLDVNIHGCGHVTATDVMTFGGYQGIVVNGSQHVALLGCYAGSAAKRAISITGVSEAVSIVNGYVGNSGDAGTTHDTGNLVIDGGSRNVTVSGTLVDEGGGASVLILDADRVRVDTGIVYSSGGGYGVRLGNGTNNPTNVTIANTTIKPWTVSVPTYSFEIRGTGHSIQNVVTNPNGGGDVNLVSTDASIWNLNGGKDSTGSPGAATLNGSSGRSAIAAGASSVAITNALVSSGSRVMAQLQTTDGTCLYVKNVVPGSGTFTINVNANCTGNTNVAWALQ